MTEATEATAVQRRPAVVDADVHAPLPSLADIASRVSPYWRERFTETGFSGPKDVVYPAWYPVTHDYELRRHLDRVGATAAVISVPSGVDGIQNPDAGAAFTAATNDWLVEEHLASDPRLHGSMLVPVQQPAMAVAEIERLAGTGRFVQVTLPVRTAMPLGNRIYHPIWEAAERAGLAVGIHFGGFPGNPSTPCGWPSHYIEDVVGMAQVAQSQLMSVISEGVLDLFPNTRIVFAECGWAWVPACLNRLDKEWRQLRREVPWIRRPASEYAIDHCRWTLRPADVPSSRDLLEVIEEIGSEDMLIYSSDYPHVHTPTDDELLAQLPAQLLTRISRSSAEEVYRL